MTDRRRARAFGAPWAIGAAGFAAAFLLWAGLLALREARAGDGFDFLRWELGAVPNKWLFAAGAPFRGDPPPDEALAAWFASGDRQSDAARRLENAVEAAIEGRIDAAVRAQGLAYPLPGPLAVWPPVDAELSGSPSMLVTSPRAEIRRAGVRPLRLGLGADELLALERAAEARDPAVSALVVPTGGVASWPAIVADGRSYRGTVATAAHEWVHHYLVFHPLGRAYAVSADARTINETVADIVGDELRDTVVERFGDPSPPSAAAPAPSAAAPPADRAAVLRALRLEVDALLAEGRIADAERRMEETRRFLEERGVYVRRINQAYFAWYGTYAARPDATDPLGPRLRELRERAGSLRRFLELVRGVTDRAGVEALLDRLRAGP